MNRYSLPPLPSDLDGLCVAYLEAAGSYSLRIRNEMLKKYRFATLGDVQATNATAFLLLRATVLQDRGEVSACRAIYQFAAKAAHGQGDLVAEAAALAQLHVDRALVLDGDTEHGSPLPGDIRLDLLTVGNMLTTRSLSPNERPLACRTLTHLMHGLALLGASDDAQALRDLSQELAGEDASLQAEIELAQAQVLATQGHIDQALEVAEVNMGRPVADPLGLEVISRQFLGTWYQAIGRSQLAAQNLRAAATACFSYEMEALGITIAMELVSVLLGEGQEEQAGRIAAGALDQAASFDLNNEVVRALDRVLIEFLFHCSSFGDAIECAISAGARARAQADIPGALAAYEMAAQCAQKLGRGGEAAQFYATCAALSSAQICQKAAFLRMQAEQVLTVVAIKVGQELDQHERSDPEVSFALDLAQELLFQARDLLVSTPNEEKSQAAAELAAWNRMMTWLCSQR